MDLGGITAEHVIYIPAVALLALYLGYIAGHRAAVSQYEKKRERMKE